jgi:hypothetical protein
MSEAGLKTQASIKRVYVPPSARETWLSYLEDNPRSYDPSIICHHDIPDGRLQPSDDTRPENDGVIILGTSLGSLAFVEEYLHKKLVKHKPLLSFIFYVANMGFSRESHKMLTGSAVPRLTRILKSVPKDESSTTWMQSADDAHLSTWLECVGAEQLHDALPAAEKYDLATLLDFPPQFGGVGLQSLMRVVDEELLGSWASITADLITFCRFKGLSSYSKIADALDSMMDPPPPLDEHQVPCLHPAIVAMMTNIVRAHTFLEAIPQEEINCTTSLIMGEWTVEIPGRYMQLETPKRPDTIVLPDLRTLVDYATTPCKHECAILKQSHHMCDNHMRFGEMTLSCNVPICSLELGNVA